MSHAHAADAQAPTGRATPWRELAIAGGQLAALSAFAFAQPLFDLLSRNAEFFAVRGSTRTEIIVFALVVAFLPALALLALEVLVGLVDRRARLVLHLVLVAGFAGLIAAQALKKKTNLGSHSLVLASLVLAAVAVLAYWRIQPVRSLLTVLAPAPLLFLVLFLFFSPVTELVFPPKPALAAGGSTGAVNASPVVFVILDEFPSTALMNSKREIDRVRYPNFAAFASQATWFRNVTTVATQTTSAVPALLTGMLPKEHALPTFSDHPKNLFTLLDRRYLLNVHERETRLCPTQLCGHEDEQRGFPARMKSLFSDVGVIYAHIVTPPVYENRLPSIATAWGDFTAGEGAKTRGGRSIGEKVVAWKRFLASIHTTRQPSLNFLHLLLPHGPWVYLPSCHRNILTGTAQIEPAREPRSSVFKRDPWLILQSYRRLLLQVQCTDKVVGQLVQRLRSLGLYDRSLIVLMSDHGVSVRPGGERREVLPDNLVNLPDIAFSVLLVKRPGEQRGQIIDRHVQTIDVLPTIARFAGVPLPWHVDGHSLFDPTNNPPRIDLFARRGRIRVAVGPLELKRDALMRRQVAWFGSGGGGPGLWAIGPHPELLGKQVADLAVTRSSTLHATISSDVRALLAHLPKGSDVLPTPIYGSLQGDGADTRLPLAVSVNGRIAAVTFSNGNGSNSYSALAPEESFRTGANRATVFLIDTSGGGLELRRLGGT
ncbi:MAG TPA: sulfatase-like hydrolase/transferase [Gaiellaceae bacterium]